MEEMRTSREKVKRETEDAGRNDQKGQQNKRSGEGEKGNAWVGKNHKIGTKTKQWGKTEKGGKHKKGRENPPVGTVEKRWETKKGVQTLQKGGTPKENWKHLNEAGETTRISNIRRGWKNTNVWKNHQGVKQRKGMQTKQTTGGQKRTRKTTPPGKTKVWKTQQMLENNV